MSRCEAFLCFSIDDNLFAIPIGSAVMMTEERMKRAEMDIKLANKMNEAMRELRGIIRDSTASASEIAKAISQQRAAFDRIATAIRSINEATRENLEGIKQIEERYGGETPPKGGGKISDNI